MLNNLNTMTKTGKQLKLRRVELDYTQEELSRLSNVSRATIAGIENGANYTNRTYQKLLKALKLKNKPLFTNDND
jgi:transcriptional regulator with XRE-family HTH domain